MYQIQVFLLLWSSARASASTCWSCAPIEQSGTVIVEQVKVGVEVRRITLGVINSGDMRKRMQLTSQRRSDSVNDLRMCDMNTGALSV